MDRGWRTVVCVASGPSLTDADCELVHRAQITRLCHVIVINDNWRKVPSADVLYACDGMFWRHHAAAIADGFYGELWTQDKDAAVDLGLEYIPLERRGIGLCKRERTIHGGSNSGFQAINLAYHFGAQRIVLLGYDMKIGPRGERHWFGSHPRGFTQGDPSQWVKNFAPLALDLAGEGVEVCNATRDTALECFPRVELAAALTGRERRQ